MGNRAEAIFVSERARARDSLRCIIKSFNYLPLLGALPRLLVLSLHLIHSFGHVYTFLLLFYEFSCSFSPCDALSFSSFRIFPDPFVSHFFRLTCHLLVHNMRRRRNNRRTWYHCLVFCFSLSQPACKKLYFSPTHYSTFFILCSAFRPIWLYHRRFCFVSQQPHSRSYYSCTRWLLLC